MRPFYRTICALAASFFRLFFTVQIDYQGTCPKGVILAANHTSFFDPPLIAAFWPNEIHFLAADYLFNIPLFGTLIRALNSHPVKRDKQDVAIFKQTMKLLQKKESVLLFPEGRRSKTGELLPLKTGVAMLSLKTNAPIVPILIEGAYSIWPPGKRFPRLYGKISITFGAPIYPDQALLLDKKEAPIALTETLRTHLESLSKKTSIPSF